MSTIFETSTYCRGVSLLLRLALGVGFLSAVADRCGLWGPPGSANVAWGDFSTFAAYTATLNPSLPASTIPALAWVVTIVEVALGSTLILGLAVGYTSFASGVLLLLFGTGMTIGTGLKSALDASVFSAAGAAFALSALRSTPPRHRHTEHVKRQEK